MSFYFILFEVQAQDNVRMHIKDYPILNLPYIFTCTWRTVVWDNISSKFRCNSFLNINGEDPLTALFAAELIKKAKSKLSRTIQIDFMKHVTEKCTNLSMTRAMFNHIPSLSQHKPIIIYTMLTLFQLFSSLILMSHILTAWKNCIRIHSRQQLKFSSTKIERLLYFLYHSQELSLAK